MPVLAVAAAVGTGPEPSVLVVLEGVQKEFAYLKRKKLFLVQGSILIHPEIALVFVYVGYKGNHLVSRMPDVGDKAGNTQQPVIRLFNATPKL